MISESSKNLKKEILKSKSATYVSKSREINKVLLKFVTIRKTLSKNSQLFGYINAELSKILALLARILLI